MKLVTKAVEEVVNFKADAEDTTAEEADAVKKENMMAVVDEEAETAEAVGIIKVTDGADRIQEC